MSSTPASAASIVPIIHDTAVAPSVFTPAIGRVARMIDGGTDRETERCEPHQQRRTHGNDDGRHEHHGLVVVQRDAEPPMDAERSVHEPFGVDDLFLRPREEDVRESRKRHPEPDGGYEPDGR